MKKLYFLLLLLPVNVLAQNQVVKDSRPAIDIFDNAEGLGLDKIFNNFILDINSNDNYRAENSKNQYRETNATVRHFTTMHLGKGLSFNTQINLSPFYKDSENDKRAASANGGGDRIFEDEGLFLREIYLRYNKEKYTLIAGKMNLNYGYAWRWDRGIWTFELAEKYRQVNKIAVGGVYRIGNQKTTGQYNFNFNVFKNDRKYLDNSLITKSDSIYKSDALAGDGSLLQSYLASVDIKFDFGEKEKLSYNFGYINLAVNNRMTQVPLAKLQDQKGFVVGMRYQYPIAQNYDIDGLVEYSKMNNLNGNSDFNEHYFSANIINKLYNNWNVTFGYSRYESNLMQTNGLNQSLSEVSFGYEFNKNSFFDRLVLQTGYKNSRNDYGGNLAMKDSVGFLLRYYKGF